MSAQSFSRRFGMGSLVHCLSGSARVAATTSSTVSDWKSTNLQSGSTGENSGGEESSSVHGHRPLSGRNAGENRRRGGPVTAGLGRGPTVYRRSARAAWAVSARSRSHSSKRLHAFCVAELGMRGFSRSSCRTRRFAWRYSSSNHGSDERWRHITVRAGASRSSIMDISVLYSRAKPATSQSVHASGRHRSDDVNAARNSAASTKRGRLERVVYTELGLTI